MLRAVIVTLIMLLSATAGCFGDKGASPPTTSSTMPPSGNETVNLTVTVINHTTQGKVGGPINITWQISLPPTLNQTFNTTHTHVHWGNLSVPDAAMGTYTNETEEQEGPIPGTYNTTFKATKAGDLHFRAHAVLGNNSYWSDEFKMNVTAGAPKPGTTYIVEIGKTFAGPISDYAPTPVNIKVGDLVKWKNIDRASLAHTATADTGAPASFDTGSIAATKESAPITFTKAGTYNYHCTVHPSTMTGTTGGRVVVTV